MSSDEISASLLENLDNSLQDTIVGEQVELASKSLHILVPIGPFFHPLKSLDSRQVPSLMSRNHSKPYPSYVFLCYINLVTITLQASTSVSVFMPLPPDCPIYSPNNVFLL